ncbi:MAG TPA: dihydrolipoamide acetyltransferase family protein [Levilinea sp.]|nr:dihydrolipoamide acetyltransferase family protein [Levilinea sp.]
MAETITMPKLGFDMAEGTLVRWVKAVGEPVKRGDILAEIETDKATVEVESSFDGTMLKHLVNEGTPVPIGDPIAIVGQEQEEIPQGGPSGGEPQPERPTASAPQQPTILPEHPQQGQPAGEKEDSDGRKRVFASPLARRMAREHDLPLSKVHGSGPRGRVVKKDVESALVRKPAAVAQPSPTAATETKAIAPAKVLIPLTEWQTGIIEAPADETISLSRLRQAIGRRMLESRQQVPHFYVTHSYNIERLMSLRQEINEMLPDGQKISVNDFVVKAAALALRRYPNLNASIKGEAVIRHGAIHIGVAVAVENGLLTIVCRNADQKPLRLISSEVREMAERVRAGRVRPEDIEGSTFSISNLGMYNVDEFIAIINPPEAAILAVGSGKQVPVVVDGNLQVGVRMKITISADHRITDGAEAAQFMQSLEDYLEHPMRLLI